MNVQFSRSQQKFLFILGITATYIALLVWLDFLKGPKLWDEKTYWETILQFSDRLIPSLNDLRNYGELNTPLPFIIFGAIEHLFHQGIFAGRLLNFVLSISMVLIIGWPSRDKRGRAILCVIGLFFCPYYLFLSGRIYTEMIACFWMLMGLVSYVHNRHILSSLAFILAIASRQYMLPFPAAIATYEFIVAIINIRYFHSISLVEQKRWIAPLVATLSIFGWIYLFQGLAPEIAVATRSVPTVQETTWAFAPNTAINFLAYIGLYIVIPEFVLFQPLSKLRRLRQRWRKAALIAVALLIAYAAFPPQMEAHGNLMNLLDLLPNRALQMSVLYGLSLLACLRFSQPNLMFFIVLFNSLLMIKAYPWDKYILPLAVAFWHWQSTGLEGKTDKITYLADRSFRLSAKHLGHDRERGNLEAMTHHVGENLECFTDWN